MASSLKKLNEKYLLAPKLIYLIVNLQFYGFHQLRSAFARDKFDISTQDYGKYTGYVQFITFFTSILIGNVTDKFKKYQVSLLSMIILSTALFCLFYVDSLMNIGTVMFWGVLLFYLILNNPKQPLIDKIMIEYLDKFSEYGSKVYGKQRLWGTFALPMATYISEWCTNKSKGPSKYNNLIYYNLIATVFAIGSVMIFSLSKKSQNEELATEEKNKPKEQTVNNTNTSGTFIELFKNFEFLFFFVIIFLNAISRSALTIYLQLFHKEILKIEPKDVPEDSSALFKTLFSSYYDKPVSTLATAGVIFEIIILFTADKIISKCGYFLPLLIAQIISLVRFLTYYLLPSDSPYCYAVSCLVELTRGMYFGLIHISSVYIATKMAPPNLRTTSQMIYQGTFSALGFLISGQIFGRLFAAKLAKELEFAEKEEAYKQIFLVNIAIALFTIGLCVIKYGFIDKVLFNRENEEKKLSKYDVEANEISVK